MCEALLVQTENIAINSEWVIIALTIPEGIHKPYFDHKGVIWLKSGADKRRVNSKEELRLFFKMWIYSMPTKYLHVRVLTF